MFQKHYKKAVVLLSGGLDSTTCLYWAKNSGYRCLALSVNYGQRHSKELASANAVAHAAAVPIHKVSLSLPWLKASSLVDRRKSLPNLSLNRIGQGKIPSTYVPGRNTIFLALGVSLADSIGASAVIAGANALDFSGYPDCRPVFYHAFEKVAKAGTRAGSEKKSIRMLTPIIKFDKAAIVRLALKLKVPLELTWSCYRGGKNPCGHCDSCKLRAKGFATIGIADPAR